MVPNMMAYKKIPRTLPYGPANEPVGWNDVEAAVNQAYSVISDAPKRHQAVAAADAAYSILADKIEMQLVRDTGVDFEPCGLRSKPFTIVQKPLMQERRPRGKQWRSCEGPIKWLQQRPRAFADILRRFDERALASEVACQAVDSEIILLEEGVRHEAPLPESFESLLQDVMQLMTAFSHDVDSDSVERALPCAMARADVLEGKLELARASEALLDAKTGKRQWSQWL